MRKNLLLLTILLLLACSNEIKIESSTAVDNYYGWGKEYRAFYLVSNYDESKYGKVQEYVTREFHRIIQTNDSLECLQFVFYKRNWNTSMFIDSEDPYNSNFSPLLPENDKKYGKSSIGWIYYVRVENSNRWIYNSNKTHVNDTIEVKINKTKP